MGFAHSIAIMPHLPQSVRNSMTTSFFSIRSALLALVTTCALVQPAFAQSEIMVGWFSTASTIANPIPLPPSLVWSTTPILPAAAIEDLTELRDAVASSTLTRKALMTTDNGRTIALVQAGARHDAATPTGVTVWLDWRVVDSTISFPDVSKIDFLSNNYAMLKQRPKGGPYVSFLVDLRRPKIRYQFIGYQLHTLRITDSGKWAALATDGSLVSGQLDASEGNIVGTSVPITGPILNLMWRKDGRFLLVEREGPTLTSYLSSNWSAIATVPGSMGPSAGEVSPVGRDAFLGWQPGQKSECTFTVSSTGQITSIQWPCQIADEVGVYVSPTRKFITTQAQKFGGFMAYFCRKTPDATASDVIPEWTAPPQGSSIGCFGWLHWEP